MKGSTIWSLMIITALFSIVFSCARQAAPSGGPKDISPPVITKSNPPNSTLNYKGKTIVITFDEYVVLDKLNEKFMVSPPVSKKPDIFLKGKNLNIEFREELKDSTTYTLYFQDAIRDLNEGNAIPDFQFVFSTGNVLDSLSVTGNLLDANSLEATEKSLVLMYRQLADSAPVKLLPDYISLADINGGFRINNVKEGTYNLYALQDKNNNKKYDLADEGFAFLDSAVLINHLKNYLPVVVVKDTSKASEVKVNKPVAGTSKPTGLLSKIPEVPLINGEYKMFLFTAPLKNHYLTSSGRKTANLLSYTLSLPPDTVKFQFEIIDAEKESYFIEKNTSGDTIDVWLTDSSLYSRPQIITLVGYPFTDSTGVTKLKTDSIPMRFTETRSTRAREALSKYKYSTGISGDIKPGQKIIFTSPTPFRTPDTSRIRLYESVKDGRLTIPYFLSKDSLTSRRYFLKANLKEESTYFLIADYAAFGNIYGDVADSVGLRFSVRTINSYGQLTMNLSNVNGKVIIQLLDSKENVVLERKVNKNSNEEFSLLEKGIYRLRAIYDLNGDGKWTTGDFKEKRQPEPVTYFNKEMDVKIDFWIVEDWDLNKAYLKEQKLKKQTGTNR
jgi:uncharacterized protein (DUF2141 family)